VLGLGKFVRADLLPDKRHAMIHSHYGTIPRLMTVPPEYFQRAVLEQTPYPVRAAYVQCANPMLSWADSRRTREALAALDFLAVSELVMTPTAALADIVLPAASHLEFDDIGHYGLGHGVVLARPRAVDPPAGCWPDMKILNALGSALCEPGLWSDDWRDLLSAVLAPSGLTFEQFAQAGHLKGPDRFEKYRESGFATPSAKVELRLSRADALGLPPLPGGTPLARHPEFPLVLTSAKDPCYLHSSYRWVKSLRSKSPVPLARIHPQTAAASGVRDGDPVTIETAAGTITQTARVTDAVPPGVVLAAYGWWFTKPEGDPSLHDESDLDWQSANYNLLTAADALGREFGTPNLKGIACRIVSAGRRRRSAP
jgi:anaerobic selenocysteine-containing dehydrogenase